MLTLKPTSNIYFCLFFWLCFLFFTFLSNNITKNTSKILKAGNMSFYSFARSEPHQSINQLTNQPIHIYTRPYLTHLQQALSEVSTHQTTQTLLNAIAYTNPWCGNHICSISSLSRVYALPAFCAFLSSETSSMPRQVITHNPSFVTRSLAKAAALFQ